MSKRIKEILFNNAAFKLLALLFSILLWWTVTSINDPTQYKSFSVPVTMQNEAALESAGKYYTVLDNSDTISVRVAAKRSIIDRLSSADFTATADLSRMENNSQVPVEVSLNRFAGQVTVSAQNYYVDVRVTNLMSSQFTIEAKTTGEVANGYALGDVKATPGSVTISGPEDVVSSISSVTAELDVSRANRTVSRNVVPKYLNRKGESVDTSKLTMSITGVEVSAEVLATKSVPVQVSSSGSLADGLQLVSLTVAPSSVQIMGAASEINNVTAINIPASAVNLSDVRTTSEISVDISSYLPSNVRLADANQSKVTVIVTLEGQLTRELSVPTANLTIQNLGQGLQGKFESSTVTVSITGSESEVQALSADRITGSVNASGLSMGSHAVTVNLNLERDMVAAATTTQLNVTASTN